MQSSYTVRAYLADKVHLLRHPPEVSALWLILVLIIQPRTMFRRDFCDAVVRRFDGPDDIESGAIISHSMSWDDDGALTDLPGSQVGLEPRSLVQWLAIYGAPSILKHFLDLGMLGRLVQRPRHRLGGLYG